MNCNLFGWAKNKKGEIVCVSEVPKGKECDCLCPCCANPLIARKGKVRIHHFAHSKDTDCQHGYEYSVHMLAKEVFQRTKRLYIPPFRLRYENKNNTRKILIDNSRKNKRHDCEVHDPELVKLMSRLDTDTASTFDGEEMTFDSVLVEQNRGNIKPDTIAVKNGHELFVEFMFTHAVDDEKYEKLVEAKAACIEIDLSNITLKNEKDSDFNLMEGYLLDKSNIRWIYNPTGIEKIKNDLNSRSNETSTSDKCNKRRQIDKEKLSYNNSDSEFRYKDNCYSIIDKVDKGGENVCDYVKKLRGDSIPWEVLVHDDKRLECRKCPDHEIDCYKRVLCLRYNN